jgi:glycosyltransferase involved in cell wall biosynthesis
MRVLMVNRTDAHVVSGGDTIQMLQTKNELERVGVDVVTGLVNDCGAFDRFDLVHVFNLDQLEAVLNSIKNNGCKSPPVVLSPIFWFHTGHWYEDAVCNKKSWQIIDRFLGASLTRKLFEKNQQTKFSHGQTGRSFRKIMEIPVRLMPNSYMEINYLRSVFNLNGNFESRCTVVPNGIIKNLYDPIPAPNQEFKEKYGLEGFVIQVGRIQCVKNQLGLIEALRNDSTPIVFVGQPSPYEPEYVDRCYEMGKRRGNVYFLDRQSPENLAGIYRLAAVHVLPSWRETPGLVSLEAGAAGCRIVSTSSGSAQEYFGDLARYCDPRDQKSIRNAVYGALSSSPSSKLRELILEKYTWEAAAEKTLEAYHLALRN